MILNKQRKAFSMLTAIFVIVMMATVAAFVMSLSGKMVKATTVQFQREQAMLLAKSYTEYAVMAVMANGDRANNCLNTINTADVFGAGEANAYTVRVNISYLLGGNPIAANNCATVLNTAVIATPESALNIILDTYVTYPDLDNPNGTRFTYHRRTLQKI